MMIRRATPDDALALMELDLVLARAGSGMVQTPEQIGPLEVIRHRLGSTDQGDATLEVIAEIDGRVVGNARLKQLSPERCRHVGVLSVGVHPDHHRRGMGRALMEHLVEHARTKQLVRLELYVRSDNVAAQALYRGLGFVHECTRARFVRLEDGTFIDDFVYCRFLE